MPAVTDKFRLASGSTRPVVTSLALAKAAGATTAELTAATGWNTATGVDYIMYRRTLNTLTNKYEKVDGTQIEGRAVLTGTTLSNMTIDAGTEPASGYAADGNTVVMCGPTAQWADDLVSGIRTEHNDDGTHKSDKVVLTTGNQTIAGTKTFSSAPVLPDNAIPAASLATGAITLGYAEITSIFSTSSTTAVQVTGLSASVTIPAGGRRVKVTFFARSLYGASGGPLYIEMSLWDGAVNTGTQIAGTSTFISLSSGADQIGFCQAVVTPAAGAKTYNVGVRVSTGSGGVTAQSGQPAFILVEAI